MSHSNETWPFFKLPLELREKIYEHVLTDPSNGAHLLLTCREIYYEAYKFLFKRPIIFRGQSRLLRWLGSAPANYLQLVSDVTIELQDVDLTPLITPGASTPQSVRTPSQLQAWQLYEDDLAKLHSASTKLPNIKRLTVCALPERRSYLYRHFVEQYLQQLHATWPELRELSLRGNFHRLNDLSFLTRLTSLSCFSFAGFAAAAPQELTDVFENRACKGWTKWPSSLRYLSVTAPDATVAIAVLAILLEVVKTKNIPGLKRVVLRCSKGDMAASEDRNDLVGSFEEQSHLGANINEQEATSTASDAGEDNDAGLTTATHPTIGDMIRLLNEVGVQVTLASLDANL